MSRIFISRIFSVPPWREAWAQWRI